MPSGHRGSAPRLRLNLESLEDRSLPAPFTLTPVIPVIDAAVGANLADVLQRGTAQGNRANVFARAGDSITASSNFLTSLGTPQVGVDRAGDGSLTDTLGFFRSGQIGPNNSFTRPSTAALGGFTSADVLARLPGELAISKAAFVLIMVGTNDNSAGVPLDVYRQNLTAIVQTALDMGVVPILSTIPDMNIAAALEARVPGFNQVIQDVGEALRVPVLNYWRSLQRLPNLGISADGVHPSVSPGSGCDLSDAGLRFGYNVRNLTTLQTLDKLRRVLLLGQAPDLPHLNLSWAPLTNALAVAAGDTTGFQVQVLDAKNRTVLFGFDPFPGFIGTVRVTLGDVTGDGVPDLIATLGPGGPPHVKVFDGQTGELRSSFYAFDTALTTGLSVASGDVNGDGLADIIVSPEAGAPAHVKVFAGTGELLRSFFAFPPSFLGGAQVASTDVNRDGRADIVVGAGRGGQGHVLVFSGADLGLLASFFAFGPSFGGLVSLAAGDFSGTGAGEVAVGVAAGGDPHVVVFRPLTATLVSSFHAYSPAFLGGIRLGTVTRDGRTQLVTASNVAAVADVRSFDALSGIATDGFLLYEVGLRRGVSFGG